MDIYREILPESYLLILTPATEPADAAQLARALRRAYRSGKPGVWVDCSHLSHLPFALLRVLVRFHHRLRQQQVTLVLCHVDGEVRQALCKLPTEVCPPVVPSLLDAERYCRVAHWPLVAAA